MANITLHRTNSRSGKYYTYAIAGVRGQLHIAPSMVVGAVPATLQVVGVQWAAPGVPAVSKAQPTAAQQAAAKAKAPRPRKAAPAVTAPAVTAPATTPTT